MQIIHAVCDENRNARGGALGDQTGKEIRESKWYNRDGGWKQYIECEDADLAAHAVTIAKAICAGNYGYNQDRRWSGYDAICSVGIENGVGDFDCSSLVLSCYRLAGLPIKEKSGSTRDLADKLVKTGKFLLFVDEAHLTNPELAKNGSLYCTPGAHVAMCIEDGSEKAGPVSTTDRIMAKGSVRIREYPVIGKTISVAHKGDIIEVFGKDEASGWYKTVTGYVTSNSRYVEKI